MANTMHEFIGVSNHTFFVHNDYGYRWNSAPGCEYYSIYKRDRDKQGPTSICVDAVYPDARHETLKVRFEPIIKDNRKFIARTIHTYWNFGNFIYTWDEVPLATEYHILRDNFDSVFVEAITPDGVIAIPGHACRSKWPMLGEPYVPAVEAEREKQWRSEYRLESKITELKKDVAEVLSLNSEMYTQQKKFFDYVEAEAKHSKINADVVALDEKIAVETEKLRNTKVARITDPTGIMKSLNSPHSGGYVGKPGTRIHTVVSDPSADQTYEEWSKKVDHEWRKWLYDYSISDVANTAMLYGNGVKIQSTIPHKKVIGLIHKIARAQDQEVSSMRFDKAGRVAFKLVDPDPITGDDTETEYLLHLTKLDPRTKKHTPVHLPRDLD